MKSEIFDLKELKPKPDDEIRFGVLSKNIDLELGGVKTDKFILEKKMEPGTWIYD